MLAARLASRFAPRLGAARAMSTKAVLPDLPYSYGALEPVISGKIMELHHSKHHNTYITNYNNLMEQQAEAEAKGDTATLINLQPAIKFNGGGYLNHCIFWENLAPPSEGGGDESQMTPELKAALEARFGSVDDFKSLFSAQTTAIQGSGWGWLVFNKTTNKVDFTTTQNQDPIVGNLVPLLSADAWEHAYYLDYENRRPEYLANLWKIVNWSDVSGRFDAARGQ